MPKKSNDSRGKRRFLRYSMEKDANLIEMGFVPADTDWTIELPNQDKREVLSFVGGNSDQDLFVLRIAKEVTGQIQATFVLKLGDTLYNYSGASLVTSPSSKSYQVHGLRVEIVSPLRQWRISYRGMVQRRHLNTSQTEDNIYVNFRFLVYSVSSPFDFTTDQREKFLSEDLKECSTCDNCIGDVLEDRYEQQVQIKGVLSLDNEVDTQKVFLWGNKSKNFYQNEIRSKAVAKRLCGFSKRGLAFHFGIIESSDYSYRYGNGFAGCVHIYPVKSMTPITKADFQNNEYHYFTLKLPQKQVLTVKRLTSDKLTPWLTLHKIAVNGDQGYAATILEDQIQNLGHLEQRLLLEKLEENTIIDDLVLDIRDTRGSLVRLSGGKGASLAQLHCLSKQIESKMSEDDLCKYVVPKGVIVTTNAYKAFIDANTELSEKLEDFQRKIWSKKFDSLEDECHNISKSIESATIPLILIEELKVQLSETFHCPLPSELDRLTFAVRSSSVLEDSEETSGAGQLTTCLSVQGVDNVLTSIKKCWASQFSHTCVTYLNGYGLPLINPMAVVIQEMVDTDVAGVMFTCNPVDGDARKLIITANYGLCETVVSATSEPDTITLLVDPENSKVLGTESIIIGGKELEQVDQSEQKRCCLSEEEMVKLAKLGLTLKAAFLNDRDIEWGLKDGHLILFQSRPITGLDNYNEWELMHEMDRGHSSEVQVTSRANVGEVMPGSMSYFGHGCILYMFMGHTFKRNVKLKFFSEDEYCPYALYVYGCAYNQVFFSINTRLYAAIKPKTKTYKGFMLSFFGHELDIDLTEYTNNLEANKKLSGAQNLKMFAFSIGKAFNSDKKLKKHERMAQQLKLFEEDLKLTPAQLFEEMFQHKNKLHQGFELHMICTTSSMFSLMFLITMLAKDDDPNEHLLQDVSKVLSSCKDVVSADLARKLKEIAKLLESDDRFNAFSTDDDLLVALTTEETEASVKFKKLLQDYGHRGYREFDPMYLQWGEKPLGLIRSIKGQFKCAGVNQSSSEAQADEQYSVDKLIDSLKTPLTRTQKFLLKKYFLPKARKAVGQRERSKAVLIKLINEFRNACWKLAKALTYEEGRLPEPELLFYLKIEEVALLIEAPNSKLVGRALQRRKIYPQMDTFTFEDINIGPDVQPNNLPVKDDTYFGTTEVKGHPVCLGKVSGRAFVVNTFDEVRNIKSGDILITYSTDIGYSPYFPLLAGIVTEIGGLVSHGAVIARELGVPCLIAVKDARRIFKTGERVLLDTHRGIIMKLDENENEEALGKKENHQLEDEPLVEPRQVQITNL